MRHGNVHAIVHGLLRELGTFQSSDFCARAGITRQAAHRHLARLIGEEVLEARGAGRGARYVAGPKAKLDAAAALDARGAVVFDIARFAGADPAFVASVLAAWRSAEPRVRWIDGVDGGAPSVVLDRRMRDRATGRVEAVTFDPALD